MTSWQTFLVQQGVCGFDPLSGVFDSFTPANGDSDTALARRRPTTDFIVPLCDAGLITANGTDAATFLHNQLTNDVMHLGTSEARLAGYCTPKGRLLATFVLWRTDESIVLHLPRALQDAILKRLKMFVLRAKVVLTDAQADGQTVQLGLAGPAATAMLTTWFPSLPAMPYATVHSDAGTLVRLADGIDHLARYLWVGDVESVMAAWPMLVQGLQPAGADAWRLAGIGAGIPTITAATQEKFVPQMVNLELIAGVDFKKGCYPGQEIVARSQYLGKLKRRMLPATLCADDVAAGMEVFSSVDPEQACGMIVEAAPSDAQTYACLVEIKLAALTTSVHLSHAQGPVLTFGTLPYSLENAPE